MVDEALLNRLLSTEPGEVYLLGGKMTEGFVAVRELVPVEAVRRPGFFEARPESVLSAIAQIAEKGLELVGIFHAHASGESRPSPLDVLGMRRAGLLWLIRSGGSVKAWTLSGCRVVEVPILTRADGLRTR
ncbi:MAG: Mov34/MPN/PAD-1 family protein [Thermofilum sp.]|uniref:JAB domain-containing protein n=1 Tax=Thermofilum pendens TaxID=2269 RepID=A0A7C4D238_THEPE